MPVSYTIDRELRLVRVLWCAPVSFREALAYLDRLRNDPDFDPSMRQISDARGATPRFTPEQVRGLARSSPYGPGSRRAIVVGSEAIYGATRAYAAQIRAGTLGVFRDADAAMEWLGLDRDEACIDPRSDAADTDGPPQRLA